MTDDRDDRDDRAGRARALWYDRPGGAAVLEAQLAPPGENQVLVKCLHSLVSRGTESLVFNGEVPESEWRRMRAPLQEGAFPHPVKYGYAAVGTAIDGAADLVGRRVFSLHPHQTAFVVDRAFAVPVPETVPSRRATLAANAETALNAIWDGGAGPCDRIAVVGGGVVGLLVAWLAARLPGAEVTLVDVDPARRPVAEALGALFAQPGEAEDGRDVVFHASATGAGLSTAIGLAGREATVVEMSWYGTRPVEVLLGGVFHSGRVRLVSSQVGEISPGRRPRRTHRDRLEAALGLLDDDRLDVLLEPAIPFEALPEALPEILGKGAPPRLAQVIDYD